MLYYMIDKRDWLRSWRAERIRTHDNSMLTYMYA
jgi:hypothetical protein